MAKLTLTFDTVEERDDMLMAIHGQEAYYALSEISEIVRSALKYEVYPSVESLCEAIQPILLDYPK